MTLPFVALHDMNPNAGTLQITGSGAWQTSSAGGVTGGVSTGGVRAGVGISAGAVATAGAGVGNSSSAEEHAIQLVGICCATALRNAGFDATTGHAAMLFAQIAGARLEALARACSDASLLRGEGIGVARLEYHDPGRNVIDFANNHNGNETIAATTTPTPTPTVSTTSTNSGAESLLLRFSSSLVSAALSDLDDDTLVELRRTALASVALAKNNPPPTSSVLPAITSNSSAAELSSSNQPLPSIPIMFIDGTSSSFPRIKPGPFPVPPPPSIDAPAAYLPSPALTSLQPSNSSNSILPTPSSTVQPHQLPQESERNQHESDSESEVGSDEEDDDGKGVDLSATSRKLSSSHQHPYLAQITPTEFASATASSNNQPSTCTVPSFLLPSSTMNAASSTSSKSISPSRKPAIQPPPPPSAPPILARATRELHQYALRTLANPPASSLLEDRREFQHTVGAAVSERQVLLRGLAVGTGAGLGASGGGGEGTGGGESLWGAGGVGGGGGGGGVLEGLFSVKGMMVWSGGKGEEGGQMSTAAAHPATGSSASSAMNGTAGASSVTGAPELQRSSSVLVNGNSGGGNKGGGGGNGGSTGFQRSQTMPVGSVSAPLLAASVLAPPSTVPTPLAAFGADAAAGGGNPSTKIKFKLPLNK